MSMPGSCRMSTCCCSGVGLCGLRSIELAKRRCVHASVFRPLSLFAAPAHGKAASLWPRSSVRRDVHEDRDRFCSPVRCFAVLARRTPVRCFPSPKFETWRGRGVCRGRGVSWPCTGTGRAATKSEQVMSLLDGKLGVAFKDLIVSNSSATRAAASRRTG